MTLTNWPHHVWADYLYVFIPHHGIERAQGHFRALYDLIKPLWFSDVQLPCSFMKLGNNVSGKDDVFAKREQACMLPINRVSILLHLLEVEEQPCAKFFWFVDSRIAHVHQCVAPWARPTHV